MIIDKYTNCYALKTSLITSNKILWAYSCILDMHKVALVEIYGPVHRHLERKTFSSLA